MICKDILKSINANEISLVNKQLLDENFNYIFAADLMSDALAMIDNHPEQTILVTGLMNASSLRTAEMLDISTIIYVRGKTPSETDLNTAQEMNLNLFSTDYTMFECCGILYQLGLKAPTNE